MAIRWRHRRAAPLAALGVIALVAILLNVAAGGGMPAARQEAPSIESAILAIHAEMTKAGESADPDRLFGHMADTAKGSVIQNGELLATRQEALDRVRTNLRGVSRVQYRWRRQYVTALSPEAALLVAEGESTVSTTAGDTFSAPFAQTVVFVKKDGRWMGLHAHQSSPRAR